MKIRFLLFLTLVSFIASAQKPTIKVDLNMEGRSETEVNQPGYTSWYINRVHSAFITVSGVTFTLTATGPTATSTMRASWSKAMVQTPYFSRLANDGIQVDNDTLLKYPGSGADLEFSITGLPVGKHTIQTYHNVWEDTLTVNHCPINVYVDGVLKHSKIKRSVKAKVISDATILLTELNVTDPNQVITLKFESVKTFVANAGKSTNLNVTFNGFELNTDDASKQAREPLPNDADMHADADSGFFNLQWKAAINELTLNHTLYFGTDSAVVINALSTDAKICKGVLPLGQTTFKVEGLSNLVKYYWRVDQTDSSGLTTKGKVWSFRPRHLAFRGAEGYGRFAIGGRGGKVVEVTNLNDAGPGSFREAVTNNIGPRTIVFNVSGIIVLQSRLVVSDRYVTIAGQTAPGKGICLRTAPFGVGSDCICRFIRSRLGAGPTYDGLGMAGAKFSITDHCSVSWTIDEAFSSRGAQNMTLQRTLISEALNIAGHQNYPAGTAHGYAATIGGDIGSFHHNLIAHCSGRNWSLGGGLDGNGYYSGRLDIFNNVVYNWATRATDGGAHEVNFVNNYYKEGAATSQHTILKADLEGTGKGSQSYYSVGNVQRSPSGSFLCNGTEAACSRTYTTSNGQVVDWTVFVDKPFFPSYATVEKAKDAYKSVLSDVGCNMPLFDEHDQRIVNETLTGTFTYTGSLSKKGGIIDSQDEAGGYEDYPEETRPANFDTDHDGLPNWWETLHGSNPNSSANDFSDANADADNDGYTALEDYLEWMSVPHYYIGEAGARSLDLAPLTAGYVNPTLSTVSAPNLTVAYSGKSALVTPTPGTSGIRYLEVKVTDAENSSMNRVVGLCVSDVLSPIKNTLLDGKFNFRVYPGRFVSQFTVETTMVQSTSASLVLRDMRGQEMTRFTTELPAGFSKIDFQCPVNLAPQMYFVELTDRQTGHIYGVQRVVKK